MPIPVTARTRRVSQITPNPTGSPTLVPADTAHTDQLGGSSVDDDRGPSWRDRQRYGGRRGAVYTGPHAPDQFLVPARDNRNESTRIWVHIQPEHDRAIAAIVAARKFPFKTHGDLVRLAIRWCLLHLEELEPVVSVTGRVEAMRDILNAEVAAIEFESFCRFSAEVIQRHIAANAITEARRLALDLRQKVVEMPDGYWKRRYLDVIDGQYGHLWDTARAGATSLGQFGAHDPHEENVTPQVSGPTDD